MRFCIFLLLAIVAVRAYSDEEQWMKFKISYGKAYGTTSEDTLRRAVFLSNLRKIEEHNTKYDSGEFTYRLDINQFADMTKEEFLETLKCRRKFNSGLTRATRHFLPSIEDKIPETINWVNNGAVTEIKDQGTCGSCWSFSTTGTVEGQLFIKTGKLVSLSEQNLMDCATECFSCNGGFMDKALEYIEDNGIMSEKKYPYEAQDDRCRFNSTESVTKISGYTFVKKNDEVALQHAVANVGPISVAIDASGLQFYKEGIYNDKYLCGNGLWQLNHGVLAVGYGSVNGTDYWLVKNSWGTSWGIDGYILMSRNNDNQCGIATQALYPEL